MCVGVCVVVVPHIQSIKKLKYILFKCCYLKGNSIHKTLSRRGWSNFTQINEKENDYLFLHNFKRIFVINFFFMYKTTSGC